MKKVKRKLILSIMFIALPLSYLSAQKLSNAKKLWKEEYNLVLQHSKDTQYYERETKLLKHALEGTPQGIDIYRLSLRCVPSTNQLNGDEYTCLKV